MKLLVLIILGLLTIGCSKNEELQVNSSIIGKWKLSEVYSDPGDGSGTFTKVNGGKILEFTVDGQVSSNSKLCFMHTNGDSEVSSYTTSEESGNMRKLKIEKCGYEFSYELKGNQLTLYYPCIEGCGERFVRVAD